MTLDLLRVVAARDAARRALVDRRVAAGHWEGRLSSSALATATAVTALAVGARAGVASPGDAALVNHGVGWLIATVNDDGGWGDTPDSVSNISTTALVWAALSFGGADASAASAQAWIARAAGSSQPDRLAATLAARYGKDRTFSVPILTMCAIAGRLGTPAEAWRLVPALPFELAVLPRQFFGALRLPVVSYALPALISMGLVRHRLGPGAPVLRQLRSAVSPRVLDVLRQLQPDGGGFLEAIPLTSFVAMSLIAAGEASHSVVRDGLAFLRHAVREDGSWPIDSNLATWVTTLSVNALAAGGDAAAIGAADAARMRDWLLAQQWRIRHPYTDAAPGGWAWTDLPGGVPDADDTAGALLALRHLAPGDPGVRDAAASAVRWLLGVQNRDGGVPTFCRGWGALEFDRSASDLTAHALRAWVAWRDDLPLPLSRAVDRAVARGVAFLARAQRGDGAFVPLWFGNQREPREENPVFGTARVLPGLAAAEQLGVLGAARIRRSAVAYVLRAQNPDGGWGAAASLPSGVEESAAAISGLRSVLPFSDDEAPRTAIDRGAAWLIEATLAARHFPASPIGLYFARLWYSEELYPLILTVGALEAIAAACQSNP